MRDTSTTVERQERISDLICITKHSYQTLLVNLYDDAKRACKSNQFILRDYQLKLKDVSTWSDQKKRDEINKFDMFSIQPILNDIVKMNYLLFETGSANKQIRGHDFIYSNILNVAREVWTKPFLLYHRVNKQEYQKNMLALEKLIIGEIKSSVRRIDKLDHILVVPPAHLVQPVVASLPVVSIETCAPIVAATETALPAITQQIIPFVQPPTIPQIESITIVDNGKEITDVIIEPQRVIQVQKSVSIKSSDSDGSSDDDSNVSDSSSDTSSDSGSESSKSSASRSSVSSRSSKSIKSIKSSKSSHVAKKEKVKRRGSLKKFVEKNKKKYESRYKDYLNPYVYAPRLDDMKKKKKRST